MMSIVDALVQTDPASKDRSSVLTNQKRLDYIDLDVLFIYECQPTWLSRVVSRLDARGWIVQCLQSPDDLSRVQAATMIVVGPTSANQHLYVNGSLCCVLPTELERTSEVDGSLSHIRSHDEEVNFVNQVVKMTENLIATGYTLKGRRGDPRFERASEEIKEALKAVTEHPQNATEPGVSGLDHTQVVWSNNTMNQVCDVISSAINAELAYGGLQPEHVLMMYLELHEELCKYSISAYIINGVRSNFCYHVCLFLLCTPWDTSNLYLSDHLDIASNQKALTNLKLMNEDELIIAQGHLITELEALKTTIRDDSSNDLQTKKLINTYRLRWEHLLIARHTARSCCSLDQLIDTLSEGHWREHEVIQVLISTERSVAPMVQSGYMRGALSVYAHVVNRLNEHKSSLYDAQMTSSITYMNSILLRTPDSHHSEVLDTFGRVKEKIEQLVKAYRGKDLEEVIHLSSAKLT
jgi:hypothetical protein